MKALISAFALLAFVGASTVPVVAHAQNTSTNAPTTTAPAKKAPAKKSTAKKSTKKKSAKKTSKPSTSSAPKTM
jgi:DNA end-binding protein Ku